MSAIKAGDEPRFNGTLSQLLTWVRSTGQKLPQGDEKLRMQREIQERERQAVVDYSVKWLQQAVRPGTEVHPMSGATGVGVPQVVAAVLAAVSAKRADEDETAVEASTLVHPL